MTNDNPYIGRDLRDLSARIGLAACAKDPEVQQLISELYAGKPLEMHASN